MHARASGLRGRDGGIPVALVHGLGLSRPRSPKGSPSGARFMPGSPRFLRQREALRTLGFVELADSLAAWRPRSVGLERATSGACTQIVKNELERKALSDTPEEVKEKFEKYSEEDVPLRSYAAVAGVFNLLFAAVLVITKASGREIPNGIKLSDIVLFGVASHKLSWLIAKDGVTSPIRAPFTHLDEIESTTNFQESPRGEGLQRSLGELLTCHFCLGQWMASFFTYGLLLAPRTTRLVAGVFAIVTLSDHLHQTYQALMKRA
jgi:hypothetical protein